MKNQPTNKDLYVAIDNLRKEIVHRVERVEDEAKENTAFRNQLVGKMTVIFAIIGIGINYFWDVVFNRS